MMHPSSRTRHRNTVVPYSCAAAQTGGQRGRLLSHSIFSALLSAPCALAYAEPEPINIFEGLEEEVLAVGIAPVYLNADNSRTVGPGQGHSLGRYSSVRDHVQLRGAEPGTAGYKLEKGANLALRGEVRNDAADGYAIHMESGSKLRVSAHSWLESAGTRSPALYVGRGAVAHLPSGVILETTRDDSNALVMEPGASVKLDGVSIRTRGNSAAGIFNNNDTPGSAAASADMGLEITNTTIGTSGEGSAAVVVAGPGATPTRISASHLEAAGRNSSGIRINGTPLVMTRSTHVTTHADSSTGVMLRRVPSSEIRDGVIRTRGANSPGIESEKSRVTLTGTTILTMGSGSAGLAAAASSLHLENTRVQALNASSYAAVLSGSALEADASVIHSYQHGAILVTDNAGADSAVMLKFTSVQGGSMGVRRPFVHVEKSREGPGKLDIMLLGGSDARGDITRTSTASGKHTINVVIKDSEWWGKTSVADRVSVGGTGSWRVSGDSRAENLEMLGGTVIFQPIGAAPAHALTIAQNLSGHGTFHMNADFDGRQANHILVQGKADGDFNMKVHATGTEPSKRQQALRLVQAHGGNAVFSLSNREGRAELGVYQYELQRNAADGVITWSLVGAAQQSAAPPVQGQDEPTRSVPKRSPGQGDVPQGNVQQGGVPEKAAPNAGNLGASQEAPAASTATPTLEAVAPTPEAATATPVALASAPPSSAAPSGIAPVVAPAPLLPRRPRLSALASDVVNTSSFATTQRIWNAEIGALGLRADALRNGATGSGLWIDGFGTRQQLDNGTGRAFSQKLDGFHIGADRVIPMLGGRWNAGVAAGYSKTRRDFDDEGKGNTTGVHIGAYAGLQHDSGIYAQGAISAGRFHNHLNAVGSDYRTSSAHYRNSGVGLSLTVGKRWDMARGWFVEPQTGADYFYLGNARYRTSNGMTVHARSADSVQLRGAVRLGKRMELAGGGDVTPYVQIGGVQELGGSSRTTLNGITLDSRTAGTRLETSVGLSADLGKRHALFAGYSYAKASNYEQPWALNAAYRYTF
jgi:outer membrane autotransporter protein